VTNWYTPVERSIFMDGLASLDVFCVATYQRSFNAGDTEQRTHALTQADEASRNYQPKPHLKVREAPDEYSPFFYKLKLLTIHEAMPGHYVQAEYANRIEPKARRVLRNNDTILALEFLAAAQAVAIVVIAYGFIATAVCVLVGPVFVPFFIVPKMEWLFWGWFRCFIQYAFYQVIAAAVVFIIGNVILGTLRLPPAGALSTVQLLAWFPVLLITFLASMYVLLKVPALTNNIFSGTAGGSSALLLETPVAAAVSAAKELASAPAASPAPTPPAPPSNAIKLGKLKRDEKSGTAKLTVNLPAPGSLVMSGKGVKKTTVTRRTAVWPTRIPIGSSRCLTESRRS